MAFGFHPAIFYALPPGSNHPTPKKPHTAVIFAVVSIPDFSAQASSFGIGRERDPIESPNRRKS